MSLSYGQTHRSLAFPVTGTAKGTVDILHPRACSECVRMKHKKEVGHGRNFGANLFVLLLFLNSKCQRVQSVEELP